MDSEERRFGEELGKVEGKDTIIRICCMRKESIFNKKKVKKKFSKIKNKYIHYKISKLNSYTLIHYINISTQFLSWLHIWNLINI